MQVRRALLPVGIALALSACGESEPALAPDTAADPSIALHRSHGDRASIKGVANHTRTVGTVTALTLFDFNGRRDRHGRTRGWYHYNFQASGFYVEGAITCISVVGNQAWVGGTVDSVVSDNPAIVALKGADMWWRSIDNGRGPHALPDSTTGLGFAFPGSTISAESWCNDKPVALIMREVEQGDVKIRD